jgi:hypothetical protein
LAVAWTFVPHEGVPASLLPEPPYLLRPRDLNERLVRVSSFHVAIRVARHRGRSWQPGWVIHDLASMDLPDQFPYERRLFECYQ